MQVPKRKPGKYSALPRDPHLTQAKFDALKDELERLKKFTHPAAVVELRRLAELGDFSENAAYQMAKGRLRGINDRMLGLAEQVKRAVIIAAPAKTGRVGLGSTVTVEINGKKATYVVLGSEEANPGKGIISANSPIGLALMGHRAGEHVAIQLKNKDVVCRIIEVE